MGGVVLHFSNFQVPKSAAGLSAATCIGIRGDSRPLPTEATWVPYLGRPCAAVAIAIARRTRSGSVLPLLCLTLRQTDASMRSPWQHQPALREKARRPTRVQASHASLSRPFLPTQLDYPPANIAVVLSGRRTVYCVIAALR